MTVELEEDLIKEKKNGGVGNKKCKINTFHVESSDLLLII